MSVVKNKIIQDKELEMSLAPISLKFYLNKLILGSNVAQIMGITQYFQESDYGWIANFNMGGTVAKYIYVPQNESSFVSSLSRNIKVNIGKVNSSNDPVEVIKAKNKVETYKNVLDSISKNAESVGMIMSLFMPNTTEEEKLKDKATKVTDSVSAAKHKIRTAATMQESGFKSISPYWTFQQDISETFGRVSLLSSFFGGLPFATNGFSDGEGYYFAKDLDGGLIVLDTWKRGGNRTNSNWTILGAMGKGKSTCIKHLILNEYALGSKIIIIDPENEVRQEVA